MRIDRPVWIASLVGGSLFQLPLTLFTLLSGGPYGAPFPVGVSPGLVFFGTRADFNPLAFLMNVSVVGIAFVAIAVGRYVWVAIGAAAGGLVFQIFAIVDHSQRFQTYDVELWLPVPVLLAARGGSSVAIDRWALLADGLIGALVFALIAHLAILTIRRARADQGVHVRGPHQGAAD